MRIIADFILAYPRFILAGIVVLIVASIFPALRVETDFNLEGFFPEDATTIEEYQLIATNFGRDDNAIGIAFEVSDISDPAVLGDIENIVNRLDTVVNVQNVISILQAERLIESGGMLQSLAYLSSEFIQRESPFDNAEARLEQLRKLRSDPFFGRLVISEDLSVTAIYFELDDDLNNFSVREQVITDMQIILADFQDQYDFRIAGIPYFRNQYVHMLNSEILMYVSISSVFIIMLLWGLFRNLRGIIIPITIVWLTILFTVAVIVLTGGFFEILSSSIAPILLCVGVADSIHLLTKYQDARLGGKTPGLAMRETIIILGGATLLTSLTTAIGFATLATSNVIPMKRFGIYTAAGVLIAFLITIFLLPTLMPWFKESVKSSGKHTLVHEWLGRRLLSLYNFVLVHHKAIVIITLLTTVVFTIYAGGLRVNGKIFDDVGPSTQVMQDNLFFNDRLGAQFPLEILIDTGQPDGAINPELLSRIADFEDILLSYAEIEHTTTLGTLISEVHRVMSPEEYAVAPLPENQALLSQYLLLLEISGIDAVDQLTDFDYSSIRIAARIADVGSYRMNAIRDELLPEIRRIFPEEQVVLSGTSILVADLTDNIVQSLAWSIGLAFLFISMLMAWLFRDIRLVFVSILPNVIPLLIAAGAMGMLGIDLKPSTAVIFTIAFGIAVDDSIHFLARLRIEVGRHATMAEALQVTTIRTGRAIVLTSLILLAGFGTLATSAFTSTMLMGALTCLTIFTAFLADILFLPALLHWINPDFSNLSRKHARAVHSAKSGHESVPREALHPA